MKLLITGASGLYGSKLAQMALQRGCEVYSSDIQELSAFGNFVKMDISDKGIVDHAFSKIKPDLVVHAATLTDVDKCETNQLLAWKINVDGTKNIVQAAKEAGSFLVYISTDYVFDGEKGCYKETDQPNPINYYGLTKLKAEEVVMNSGIKYCIGRPSVIYGSTPAAGKVNFVLWVIEKLLKGERIKIVTDQYNTPTLNSSLAEMTLEIVERKLTGIYHLTGVTRVSRLEFAQLIAEVFGLDRCLIDPVESSAFTWPAKRPMDSSLDTTKAQRYLHNRPLDIHSALERLKSELASTANIM